MGRKSKAEIRQKEILFAFYETVKELGIEHASIAKIAAKMDVNPSLLLHYFDSKEDIEAAMVEQLMVQFEGNFKPQIEEMPNITAKLQLAIVGMLSLEWLTKVDPGVFYSFYCHIFRNKKLRKRFQKMYKVFHDYITELLVIAKSENVINQDIDPYLFATYLVSFQEGNNFYQHMMKGEVNGRQLAEHHAEMIFMQLGLKVKKEELS